MELRLIEHVEIPEKKRRLIEAAVRMMLRHGYTDTSVDQICTEAGVTKGSFFHYFASKEEICRAAMEAWSCHWEQILVTSGIDDVADPFDRLDALFDVMSQAYMSQGADMGCLVGTVAQEVATANRSLGDCCEAHLDQWRDRICRLLVEAKEAHPPKIDFEPESLADFMLVIVQGTMLVSKTRQDPSVNLNSVRHCRAYVHCLFGKTSLPWRKNEYGTDDRHRS